jgi:hypothetical protein
MRNFRLVFIVTIVFVTEVCLAQPGGGGGPGGGEPVPLPGLAILLAAGAFLGIRTLVKNKKSASQK